VAPAGIGGGGGPPSGAGVAPSGITVGVGGFPAAAWVEEAKELAQRWQGTVPRQWETGHTHKHTTRTTPQG